MKKFVYTRHHRLSKLATVALGSILLLGTPHLLLNSVGTEDEYLWSLENDDFSYDPESDTFKQVDVDEPVEKEIDGALFEDEEVKPAPTFDGYEEPAPENPFEPEFTDPEEEPFQGGGVSFETSQPSPRIGSFEASSKVVVPKKGWAEPQREAQASLEPKQNSLHGSEAQIRSRPYPQDIGSSASFSSKEFDTNHQIALVDEEDDAPVNLLEDCTTETKVRSTKTEYKEIGTTEPIQTRKPAIKKFAGAPKSSPITRPVHGIGQHQIAQTEAPKKEATPAHQYRHFNQDEPQKEEEKAPPPPPPVEEEKMIPPAGPNEVKPVDMKHEEFEEVVEAEKSPKDKEYLIRFPNVSIISFLDYISKITNKNFIFDDSDLDFNVTIISSTPTSIDNIMTALLQELRVHNLSLLEVGNNLIIHRNTATNSPATIITDETQDIPHQSDIVTRVFNLSNSSPESMAEIIRPMLSSLALVEPVVETGHLIVTDIAPNIKKIETLVDKLDTPALTFDIGQYQVVNGDVPTIIEMAQLLIRPIAGDKPLEFVSHPARKSIYVISVPHIVDTALKLLKDIDNPSDGESVFKGGGYQVPGGGEDTTIWEPSLPLGSVENTKFHVYKLQYRIGDQIKNAINSIGDSLSLSGVDETELITTINSVQWIESSNSLVYTGTQGSIDRVTDFIAQIDIPVRQVLVEVLLIETTVNNALNFGVDWGTRFGGGEEAGSQAFLSAGSPLTAALDTTVIGGAVNASGLARTAGFNMGVIGRKLRAGCMVFNSIGALVNMLHTDTKTNVVMNPKLLVEENTPAEAFFGINTAFQTQSIVNDQGSIVTNNVEFRDVGSLLRVTPIIGANDLITLEIEQEVSTVVTLPTSTQGSTAGGATETVTATQATTDVGPTTRKSNTKTRIHVPNGYFVIMSGMILDEDTRTRTQIPCLGGIPGLGAAFSQKSNEGNKRNLLFFIRPLIVEGQGIHNATRRQQEIYKQKTPTRHMWEHETREALDYLNLKDTDPSRKLNQW